MSRQMPRGFIWCGKFHLNDGGGHEAKARLLIGEYKKKFPDEDWNWFSSSAQDFLVMNKKAIQIGSGTEPLCAIACGRYYTEKKVSKILRKYNLEDYRILIVW